ncbi:SDR family oxidoreductase [Glycomyces sp. NPDC046736]|uniref:SDR family oxidoreductase n=1 Tax=Glycomyces sp. NPDC046736 TaxID=3155615 RepID=UPI0033FEC2A6
MILVTGATGSTGRQLVSQLRERGAAFRALVRDEAKGRALGAEYAVGDFEDRASLAAAMDGVERVFLASPGAQAEAPGGEQPMIRWERNAIDAAKAAGVRYVVKLSVLDAKVGGPMSAGGHGATEAYLKESGMEWTMLQPGGFMQNFLDPAASLADEDGNLLGTAEDARVAFIDCYDIAACAAVLLTGEVGRGAALPLTGPEAISYQEVAAELTRAWGRPVGYRVVSEEAIAKRLRGFGLEAGLAEELASLYAGIGEGRYSAVTDAVRDLTGRGPRSFEQFMAAHPEAFPGLAIRD